MCTLSILSAKEEICFYYVQKNISDIVCECVCLKVSMFIECVVCVCVCVCVCVHVCVACV